MRAKKEAEVLVLAGVARAKSLSGKEWKPKSWDGWPQVPDLGFHSFPDTDLALATPARTKPKQKTNKKQIRRV